MIFPQLTNKCLLFIPIIGLGIAWASIMGVPYIMAVRMIPSSRYGVYMGIINMMIVVPMLIQTVTFGAIFANVRGDNPNARDHLRRDPARLRRGHDDVDQGAADRPGRRQRPGDAGRRPLRGEAGQPRATQRSPFGLPAPGPAEPEPRSRSTAPDQKCRHRCG